MGYFLLAVAGFAVGYILGFTSARLRREWRYAFFRVDPEDHLLKMVARKAKEDAE